MNDVTATAAPMPDWTNLAGYAPGMCLQPIGSLKRHSKFPGCWVGTLMASKDEPESAIVIHEAKSTDGSDTLVLFYNPQATELLREAAAQTAEELR